MNLIPVTHQTDKITFAVTRWLADKRKGGQEETRTHQTYKHYIEDFRAKLQSQGLDLDGQPISGDHIDELEATLLLSTAAEGWALTSPKKNSISAATYNQRLSVLSSFYVFARKRLLLIIDNPIDLLERRDAVNERAKARPLPKEKVEQILRSIDRSVAAGRRDYALLLIFLQTGRRASEVLSLQWKHVEQVDNTAILHFEHCKGGKQMSDRLAPRAWKALREYLTSVIASLPLIDTEQHLWLSFSMNHFKQPLTLRGLADIFKTRVGTMKIHTTRHTFANGMRKAGADTRTIQKRLGHSSEQTTERYLEELESDENAYADALLDYLGVED